MTRATIAGGAFVTALVLLVLAARRSRTPPWSRTSNPLRQPRPRSPLDPGAAEPAAEVHPGFLYGRITDR